MKIIQTSELFHELQMITEENIDLVQKKVTHLGKNQLTWSPTKDSWSIQDILAHINKYAEFYNAAFLERIQKTKFREPKETFTSSPLGRSAWRSMKLGNAKNIKRKFRAPKGTNPKIDTDLISGNEVHDFLNYQHMLLDILEKAKSVNIRKAKVGISISRIVRLRMGDAFMFVIYHNQRHIQQIIHLLNHPKFPKKHAVEG
jgi:hypothetical protein